MSERTDFIRHIERLPEAVAAAANGLSDKQLDTPTGEGKWTIRQIIHHIADANINAYTRMKLIVTETKPILKPYDQDRWAALPDGTSEPLEATFGLLRGLHLRWSRFLNSLSESDWSREGIHLENGKVTLDDVLKTYSTHGERHTEQIVTFRKKMNW